jgi:large subunit ribosomal protein L4
LQLADASILEEEPEIDFPVLNYSFATLDVPADITVKKFLQPDAQPTSTPLERKIFEVAIRKDIIHNVIRYIRHKKRQPKKLKRLNEISGSKKKPRPQKGTGQSQVGNKRNSVWRGGQKAFGPVLRDYSIELNRKVRALGMMMTLAAKFREGNLLIFDSLAVPTPRTKDLSALLAQHGLAESSLMIVELDYALDPNFELASRNLRDVDVRERRHCNVYEILKKDKLVLSQRVFEDIQQRLLYQYTYSPKRRTMLQQQMLLEECAELVELRNLESTKVTATATA